MVQGAGGEGDSGVEGHGSRQEVSDDGGSDPIHHQAARGCVGIVQARACDAGGLDNSPGHGVAALQLKQVISHLFSHITLYQLHARTPDLRQNS